MQLSTIQRDGKMLRIKPSLIWIMLVVWSVAACSEELGQPKDQRIYQCPGLAAEGRGSAKLSEFEMIIMDRRVRKDLRYSYDFIGIGFFYDNYAKFSAELPDVPDAAAHKYTISSPDTYFVCQEINGAFLFAQRIHFPAICEINGDTLICVEKFSPKMDLGACEEKSNGSQIGLSGADRPSEAAAGRDGCSARGSGRNAGMRPGN